jgi:methionyl-tRNA formyltransferase
MLVGCGSGALLIQELQRAGSKRMSAADFLRGVELAPGEILGK